MTFVEVRGFRGTRRSSVYRECALPAGCVERMARIAERLRLGTLASTLASLDRGQARVSRSAVRDFAHEVEALRLSGELLELDDELVELADVATWCSRASKQAWLTVRRTASS